MASAPVTAYVTPGDPVVQRVARGLRTPGQAFTWVCTHLRYRREDRDYWRAPAETIQLGYGDCEDLANTLTSILRAMGYPAESVVYRVDYHGKTYYHVATRLGGTVYDPSTRAINPGWLRIAKPLLAYTECYVRVYDPEGWELIERPGSIRTGLAPLAILGALAAGAALATMASQFMQAGGGGGAGERVREVVEEMWEVARVVVPLVTGLAVGGSVYKWVKPINEKAAGVSALLLGTATAYGVYSLLSTIGKKKKGEETRVVWGRRVAGNAYEFRFEKTYTVNMLHRFEWGPMSADEKSAEIRFAVDLLPHDVMEVIARSLGVNTAAIEFERAVVEEFAYHVKVRGGVTLPGIPFVVPVITNVAPFTIGICFKPLQRSVDWWRVTASPLAWRELSKAMPVGLTSSTKYMMVTVALRAKPGVVPPLGGSLETLVESLWMRVSVRVRVG